MSKFGFILSFLLTTSSLLCQQNYESLAKGTYEFDIQFFKKQKIDFVELIGNDSSQRIIVIPAYQGRVMTSTANGFKGNSFGWINYNFISSAKVEPNFNPVGGEERFWIGPEGGMFSFYFEKNKEQVFKNWRVPSVIDTESFDIVQKTKNKVTFTKHALIKNASGYSFNMNIERVVSLLSKKEVEELLQLPVHKTIKMVAFKTENVLKNIGNNEWTKQTGLPSIWMLSMLNTSPKTSVFIPYRKDAKTKVVKDDYFGKVPENRLRYDDKMIYFKTDGKMRTKIGVSQSRAKNFVGSYNVDNKLLTLVWFNLPGERMNYVNSQWGTQSDPFSGDVINSYNDGPLEDGSIMGPFYEIETSSPGAILKPNESVKHTQCMIHLQGEFSELNDVVKKLFGVSLTNVIEK